MDTTEVTRDKLITDMKVVLSDAEELLKASAGQAGEKVAAVRERMQERLVDAKARLAQAETAAVEQAKLAARATDEFVHERPWTAVGIAGVVGLALGVLIGRR